MEALTAVAVAALTIYDMVKAVDKAMVIGDVRLMLKTGGKSGNVSEDGWSRMAGSDRKMTLGRSLPVLCFPAPVLPVLLAAAAVPSAPDSAAASERRSYGYHDRPQLSARLATAFTQGLEYRRRISLRGHGARTAGRPSAR